MAPGVRAKYYYSERRARVRGDRLPCKPPGPVGYTSSMDNPSSFYHENTRTPAGSPHGFVNKVERSGDLAPSDVKLAPHGNSRVNISKLRRLPVAIWTKTLSPTFDERALPRCQIKWPSHPVRVNKTSYAYSTRRRDAHIPVRTRHLLIDRKKKKKKNSKYTRTHTHA